MPRSKSNSRIHPLYAELLSQVNKTGPYSNTKRIAHNTYLILDTYRSNSDIQVKFHSTNIISVSTNGTVTIDNGGWYSNTTNQRINDFLSTYRRLIGHASPVPISAPADAFQFHKDYRSKRDGASDDFPYVLGRHDPAADTPARVESYRQYQCSYSARDCYYLAAQDQLSSLIRNPYISKVVDGSPYWDRYSSGNVSVPLPGYAWQKAAEDRKRKLGNYKDARTGAGQSYYSATPRTTPRPLHSYDLLHRCEPVAHTFLRTITATIPAVPNGGAYLTFPYFHGVTISPRGKVSAPPKAPRGHKYHERTIGQAYARARGPYYKVLTSDMRAPFQTDYTWRAERWQGVKGPLVPCANGLHCATAEQLVKWVHAEFAAPCKRAKAAGVPVPSFANSSAEVTRAAFYLTSRVFLALTRGPVYDAGDKCVTRSLKLTRELSSNEVHDLLRDVYDARKAREVTRDNASS
jgi:hypothetical protein